MSIPLRDKANHTVSEASTADMGSINSSSAELVPLLFSTGAWGPALVGKRAKKSVAPYSGQFLRLRKN